MVDQSESLSPSGGFEESTGGVIVVPEESGISAPSRAVMEKRAAMSEGNRSVFILGSIASKLLFREERLRSPLRGEKGAGRGRE